MLHTSVYFFERRSIFHQLCEVSDFVTGNGFVNCTEAQRNGQCGSLCIAGHCIDQLINQITRLRITQSGNHGAGILITELFFEQIVQEAMLQIGQAAVSTQNSRDENQQSLACMIVIAIKALVELVCELTKLVLCDRIKLIIGQIYVIL